MYVNPAHSDKLCAMRALRTFFVFITISTIATGQSARSELKDLYDAHQWLELRDALADSDRRSLYRGAVAAALNDVQGAEEILRAVIRQAPRSDQARHAYRILSHAFLDVGRYHQFRSVMEEKWAAFPDESESSRDRTEFAGLLSLPDQATLKRERSLLRHSGDLWVPLFINGKPVTFFLDTGAGLSTMSESEAKGLGLTVRRGGTSLGSSTSSRIGFRCAVAKELVVGNIRLRNVSFAVLPDDGEPWVHIPKGRRGLLGMPVLLAFGTLRWAKNGTIELGAKSPNTDQRRANMYFVDDHLVTDAVFHDRKLPATLDSGAETTDLYSRFAKVFDSLLREFGTRSVTEGTGVAGTESFDSITLPELQVRLGDLDTRLHPARVLLKQIGPERCVGNLGLDLLASRLVQDGLRRDDSGITR